jgi:predicted O-methyltransferase YrrM
MSYLSERYDSIRKNHPSPFIDTLDHLPYFRQIAKGNVMEIGTDVGNSTTAFLLGLEENDPENGRMVSVDVRPGCWTAIPPLGAKQWLFVCEDSFHSKTLSGQIPLPLDVLYVDGDHSYIGAHNDLFKFGPLVKSGGLILIHDIYHNQFPGVMQAWKEFLNSGLVSQYSHREASWGLGVAVRA